jgi:TonB-linked SusC/RagA family outer membrane protein
MKIVKYKRKIWLLFLAVFILAPLPVMLAQTVDSTETGSALLQPVAYGSQPEWMVSQGLSTVKGNDLEKSFTLNLANTLYGKLPGLTVMQGGAEPGLQSPTLRIRGTSTYGSGKGILVIVDGFESSFEELVPEEIASVTVLKDASATAMYGSKGANGVLLVTTKRGEPGKLKISIGTQHGITSATHLPKMLGSYDYASLFNEGFLNDGGDPLNLPYDQATLDAYRNGTDLYLNPDVNWYNEVLRKSGYTSKYNVNFSGGTSAAKYFVLVNYITSSGLYKRTGDLSVNSINQDYGRFNFRSNVDVQLTKGLSTTLILGGTITDKKNPAANNTGDIFDIMSSNPPNAFPVLNPNASYGGNTSYNNPYGDIMETGFFTSNARTFQGTVKMTQTLNWITEGLSISAAVSLNNSFTSLSNKSRTYSRFAIDTLGGNYVYSPIGLNTSLVGAEGTSDQWQYSAVQAYLNYDRTFGETSVSGIMMMNNSSYTYYGGGMPYRDMGMFGRYSLAMKNKYMAEFSFGLNGSESFPDEGRWGFFPAASAGWIVSEEAFLSGNNAISYLKLRGSYGLTGNDNIGGNTRYLFTQDYITSGGYNFGSPTQAWVGGVAESQVANPGVTWEKQKQLNIGIEATFFERLDLSVDIFNQDRFDILATAARTVPAISGMVIPQLNLGEVNNKGIETVLRLNSKSGGSIQYFIEGSLWYAKNEIIYNAEPVQPYDYLYESGNPIDQPFLYEAIGFFADQDDINNHARQIFTQVRPGDLKYKDQNDDGIIDQNDFYPVGNPSMPNLTAALRAGLNFKGFDLEFLFQGVTNRTVYLSGNFYRAFQNNGTATEAALGRWTPSTASSATYPRLSAQNNLNNFQPSSFWQRDGSFIKLRFAELGYTLPASITGKAKIDNVRLYLNGTDLFSFDHMDFTDPEDLYGYPPTRTISIGARLNF